MVMVWRGPGPVGGAGFQIPTCTADALPTGGKTAGLAPAAGIATEAAWLCRPLQASRSNPAPNRSMRARTAIRNKVARRRSN